MSQTSSRTQDTKELLFKQRFLFLLIAQVVLLFGPPIMRALRGESDTDTVDRIVISGLFWLILIAAVGACSEKKLFVWIAILLVATAIVVQAYHVLSEATVRDTATKTGGAYSPLQLAPALAAILFAVVVILRHLFHVERVTFDTLCAAVCVYLFFAIAWAVAYTMVDAAYDTNVAFRGGRLAFGGEHTTTTFYFSLVTLTTLGYGDIVPVTPEARMLVTLQAVVGQIYLTVLVARLVGLHISNQASKSQAS